MAGNEDRKRLRQLNQRISIKREDVARLREELSTLIAERKALKEKLAAQIARSES